MPEFPEKPPPLPQINELPIGGPPPSPLPKMLDPRHDFGVPRRYGLDSILAAVTFFALWLGLLTFLGVRPVLITMFVLYVAGVGLSQALLFGGKNPRAASIISGPILAVIIPTVFYFLTRDPNEPTNLPDYEALAILVVVVGPVLGYFVGTFVAGVFLVLDGFEWLMGKIRPRRAGSGDSSQDGDPFAPSERHD
ncbi:MAG: hypothetical protein AB7O62_20935 [Pirellulales bacterium]